MLQGIVNPIVFLSPLTTQEAVYDTQAIEIHLAFCYFTDLPLLTRHLK
ncbi:MAG: hypothetical protein M0R18_14025 [Deltaproteobacteria bacterium]|jgi:hypothetical protein|nr:hypothetical protein [Deltaproteobacteria bacterium]MDX9762934.1 hypothetical protein [Desulfomonilia bacterium]HPX19759.1 hypothetical protein [Deltaproteobacteria bacterium]